ncbi:MAG: substrate-binding domain-containing protein [Planktotalea sp.]|uniref:substrate-binding domain-containing protein n=1 Tax=Planktotalea sp. TaxID=2029877 RepID=UPI003C71138A
MIRLFAFLTCLIATSVTAETLRLAVTTSFHNSGLSDVLLPAIAKDTGIEVQLLVVGTGQALKLGEAGDVDAILVHSKASEEKFVEAGFATHRREIMYNDFVFIGPDDDPAQVRSAELATEALERIATAQVPFISRGDESGTHKKERALWQDAQIDPETAGDWYKSVGSGMGASLNTASGFGAYIIADRASWLNFDNKRDLALLFSGDPALFNQYAYLPVNPNRHPHVNAKAAEALEDWLTSLAAQALINTYKINNEALFVFNARR